jgi:hypothetical protein
LTYFIRNINSIICRTIRKVISPFSGSWIDQDNKNK